MSALKNWPDDDKPREKLIQNNPEALSNAELLSIILNTGTREKSPLDLSKELLSLSHNSLLELGRLSLNDLQQVKGVGLSKAAMLAAVVEFGRRRHIENVRQKVIIAKSSDIAPYLQTKFRDLSHEVFGVLYLNRGNRVKHFEIISKGGLTGTVADPRIILKKAVEKDAINLILTHNHPSGNLHPSRQDEELTQKVKNAARYFDISVIDHIIVSDEGYFSFAENGLL